MHRRSTCPRPRSRPRARSPRSAVTGALLLALALSGCAGAQGGGEPRPSGSPSASASASSSASASASPTPSATPDQVFDRKHTDVEVAPGEAFALRLPANPSAGYDWVLDDPEPDSAVVRRTGERDVLADTERMGAPGTLYLDHRAVAEGRTQVKLRHCFRCGTDYEKVDEDHPEKTVTFHITVRK
ncbi:protease inhibitor I42 family protein [Streptomyces daliensis]|uniref:Protease inhibitor I42 family protein n=1 Tax=Streptomyces daliensis TaxID=299421 RepID=A0A8T4ISI9_9ACTN|nr:protease inhibitor I42 family protein [Streptomyces daliensis]